MPQSKGKRPTAHQARPLRPDEVQRVHRDVIARIRRVLESHGLNPIALGVPPRSGDKATSTSDFADGIEFEQPLLDFGERIGIPSWHSGRAPEYPKARFRANTRPHGHSTLLRRTFAPLDELKSTL